MNNLTDEQLIENYLKGNNESLEILIKRYLVIIYNFVFGYVKDGPAAEDITQEIFVKVWKSLKKFKSQYKFKSWLYTIAKNTCLDYLKKNKPIVFSELERREENFNLDKLLSENVPSPGKIAESADNKVELDLAIEQLPEKYRSTMNLHYKQGLKFREIADLLKESIDTIKTRNRRALIYLRKLIKK